GSTPTSTRAAGTSPSRPTSATSSRPRSASCTASTSRASPTTPRTRPTSAGTTPASWCRAALPDGSCSAGTPTRWSGSTAPTTPTTCCNVARGHLEEQMVKTRLLAPVLVAALALGLTACADPGFLLGGASGGTTGTSSPTPGTDAPGAEDDDAEAGAALDPAACLVGTWRADNDFFLAAMRQFGTQVTSVDGQVTVAFAADGSYTTGYADWTITAVEEGIEVTVRRDGV